MKKIKTFVKMFVLCKTIEEIMIIILKSVTCMTVLIFQCTSSYAKLIFFLHMIYLCADYFLKRCTHFQKRNVTTGIFWNRTVK